MSARKSITVTRTYKPAPDDCARALALLLKRPVILEGSPTLATLEDTRGESKNGSRAKPILPR
jgi:hypothetical protein